MRDFIKALIGLGATYGWYGRAADALPLLEEGIELARRYGEDRHLVYAIGIKNGGSIRSLSAKRIRELDEAIAIGRENGFRSELIYVLGSYAGSLMVEGKIELATPYVEEALELARQINNPYMNAVVQAGKGFLALLRGDLATAKEQTLLALKNYEALNMKRSTVTARSQLAHIHRRAGDFEEADAYYRQSILGWQELGHLSAVAHQIECFAYLAIACEQYDRAATLLGSAQSARQQLKEQSVNPHEIQELSEAMDQLATAMGEDERDRALAKGNLIDLDSAVELALNEKS
jgi:tetratricopeptide (TPR) repeat protein